MNKSVAHLIGFVVTLVFALELAAADISFVGSAPLPEEPLSLWYRKPAAQWVEALPIGNGRLGAMVFGGINQEELQLNEDTLWAGGPYDPVNPEAKAALPEARRLIFDGQYTAAAKLIGARIMAKPLHQMPYETLGSLLLTFPDTKSVKNHRRDLDLDTAIATVSYSANDVKFRREFFSSPVDQVVVARFTADKRGEINFTAALKTPQKASVTVESGDTLVMRGVNGTADGIKGSLKFQLRVKIIANGGKVIAESDHILVTGADEVILLTAAATSYRSFQDASGDPEANVKKQIADSWRKSFKRLVKAHIAEHQRLFRRVSLNLGASDDRLFLEFSPKIKPVKLELSIIPPLLWRVREICDLADRPSGRPGCRDCSRLETLVKTAQRSKS